jgi:large subunit ribosomal protein L3
MGAAKSPRKGSLQYWPRKRISKFLPRVNWKALSDSKNLKGFIAYKAGMASVHVKDLTPNSMTKDKKIAIPVTIIECPPMKIFSIRSYKDGKVIGESLNDNLDKELKGIVKLPKKTQKKIEDAKDCDDIRLLVYSQVKKTGIKKTPDLTEVALSGTLDQKRDFVKENLKKEISIADAFDKGSLVDFHGLTKGKGFQGPVKRFGIKLRQHKSEKGVRKVGSVGPWHPRRITFRVPRAGQLGLFTRISYNNKIINIGKAEDNLKNIKNFGKVNTDYILVRGSVQGPAKRQLLITTTLRPTKEQNKKNYEFIEVIK